MSRVPTAILLGVFVLTLLVGCGQGDGKHNAISGQVTLDGKPLEQGSILFTMIDGSNRTAAGGVIEKGRYQLTSTNGPGLGSNRVEIHALRKTGRTVPKPFPANHEMIEEQVEAIPLRFNSQSTLTFEVKPGDNTANFDVTSK
jgi:hypothetical protein